MRAAHAWVCWGPLALKCKALPQQAEACAPTCFQGLLEPSGNPPAHEGRA